MGWRTRPPSTRTKSSSPNLAHPTQWHRQQSTYDTQMGTKYIPGMPHALPDRDHSVRTLEPSVANLATSAFAASTLRTPEITVAPPTVANTRTVSRPMPLPPPVTTATLPVRSALRRASSAVLLLPREFLEQTILNRIYITQYYDCTHYKYHKLLRLPSGALQPGRPSPQVYVTWWRSHAAALLTARRRSVRRIK